MIPNTNKNTLYLLTISITCYVLRELRDQNSKTLTSNILQTTNIFKRLTFRTYYIELPVNFHLKTIWNFCDKVKVSTTLFKINGKKSIIFLSNGKSKTSFQEFVWLHKVNLYRSFHRRTTACRVHIGDCHFNLRHIFRSYVVFQYLNR